MSRALDVALKAVRAMRRELYAAKWSVDNEALLFLWWNEGKTCGQIELMFVERGFKVSRSAVAAKVKRMREKGGYEMPSRPTPIQKKEPKND